VSQQKVVAAFFVRSFGCAFFIWNDLYSTTGGLFYGTIQKISCRDISFDNDLHFIGRKYYRIGGDLFGHGKPLGRKAD
jgi:hypothetical protein